MSDPTGICECGCGGLTARVKKTQRDAGRIAGQWARRLPGHGRKNSKPPYLADDQGCWIWQHYIDKDGYGKSGIASPSGSRFAHRVMYERLVGAIPAGLHLDHLCRVRSCVNPEHLEPVTPAENSWRSEAPTFVLARADMCARGHSLIGAPKSSSGSRRCRPCSALAAARRRAKMAQDGEIRGTTQHRRRSEALTQFTHEKRQAPL